MVKVRPEIDKTDVVISIRGLYKSFDDTEVLQGVDLDLYRGENLVILGRSGTGKSVLIKIIAGLLKPDDGMVNVLGKDVAEIPRSELNQLRLKLGFSFQSSALYDSMTVHENLEFPLKHNAPHMTQQEIDDSIDFVLDAVGLAEKSKQMTSALSGGQRKRIGIARTLILKPEIILYDEPTAGLDPITSQEIINLINTVQKRFNTSSIIITHDLTCARETGDRIVMLLDGKLQCEGTFEKVFSTNDERVRAFYNYNFFH